MRAFVYTPKTVFWEYGYKGGKIRERLLPGVYQL